MKTEFVTPVGRLVQGDAFVPKTTDKMGAPLTVKSGPNIGQPTQQFLTVVAFRKGDHAFEAFRQQIVSVSRAGFPNLFDAAGNCLHPQFAFKIQDGDGYDGDGKPNNVKPGFAGHWVVKFSSSFAPRCFYAGRYQPHEQIQDPNAIQRGYYVRIAGTIEANNNPQKPGVYLNLGMVELVGGQPSDIIRSGPDASSVFGASAAQLPPGVSPIVPGNSPAAPAPAVPASPAAMPAPLPAAPAVTSPVSVTPHPGFLMPGAAPAAPGMSPAPTGPGMMAPPAVPPVPTSPSEPQMTAKAGGATYAQFKANGWTDEALRAEGYIV